MMHALKRKTFRKVATVFIALGATLGSTSHAEAALLGPSSNYIVQITPAARAAIESAVKNAGGTIDARYQYAFDGFVVKLPDMLLPLLKKIPNILTIEKDQPVTGLAIQQNQTPTPSWGIDRIDQREVVSTVSGYQGSYGYRSAGAGSTIYIGDTGIYPHEDLAGRISTNGFSGIADGNGTVDCNGHGTHVATTAAGTQYGVAKQAKLVPVRILNCAGSGSYATVIAGLDWIMSPLNTNSKSQAVVNLSIGGPASTSLNDAIRRLTNAGITVVAAAGNENSNACTRSPASAPSAITVGATTIADAKAYYSNWGTCVDIHAPGSGITGGWYNGPASVNTISGTSMATPHVTGAAAVFLGLNPSASVAQVAEALAGQSTKGAVTGLDATTVNNLLYVSPTDGGPAIVAPAAQITTITEVTHLQAKATVEINPNNAPTTASIQYATDAAFTSIVKSINLTPTALDGGSLISLPVVLDGLTPSSEYFVRVSASNESGSFTTQTSTFKSLAPPVTPPTMTANSATSITGWSARLNATVVANNGTTTVSFVYGTDPDFITNTQTGLADPQTVGGSTARTVGLDISFLAPLTTYYYKVVGSNSAASVQSNVISFTTPAVVGVVPTVETIRPVGGLNTPTTTITGRINPMGQTTSVRLVYGTDQSLTVYPRIVDLTTKYTGVETVTVTADMTGLTPGYRYYYRFEATNAAGITKPVPLTNTGNPLMPVISNTIGANQTQTSVTLQTRVNPGASNTRTYFIYGTDPLLETGTTTVQGTPFALTNAISNAVTYSLTGLKPNTTIYFRAKVIAYTGPLVDQGGTLLGPIVSIQTLMPVRTPQTITFTLPTSRAFVAAPTPLTATASSGLPITYSTTTPSICQIVTTETGSVLVAATPIPALAGAACVVTASQNGDETFAPAIGIGRTINFLKTGQVINFATPANKDLASLNPLVATSTSGLPVTLTSSTPATCSVVATANGGFAAQAVAGIPADTSRCTILATQPGDDVYSSASASRTFTWTRTATVLKATWSTPVTVDGSALNVQLSDYLSNSLGESQTGRTPLTFTSLTPKVCTVGGVEFLGTSSAHSRATIRALWNGTCQISIGFAGNTTYSPITSLSAVSITGMITPQPGANASQTIAFSPQTSAPAGTKISLVAKATSNLPVAITTTTPLICTLTQNQDGSYVVTNVAGLQGDSNNCVLVANQAGDTSWAAAPTATRTIRFTRMAQSISFTMATSRFYGGAPTVLSATSTSGLPVTFSTTTPAICKVDLVDSQTVLNYVLPMPAASYASCYVVASQAGDGTYSPASSITRTIQFRKESTSILATWSGAITTTGTAVDFVVKSASQPSLNEAVAGTTPLVITSNTPSICRVINTAYVGSSTSHTQTTVKAMWNGNCILQAAFAGNSYWLSSSATTSRSITGMFQPEPGANVAQTISISAPTSSEIGAPTPVTIVATSKLAPVVKSLTPTICEITPTATAFAVKSVAGVTGNGNICTIEASQPGNDSWLAAKAVTRNITINKAGISVRLSWLSTTITGTTPAYYRVENRYINSTLNGGLNSIGHISTFITTTPAICSVSNVSAVTAPGGTYTQANVTGIANGTCSITYGFAGDDTRNAAYRTQLITVTGIK